jgi:hypothetical protein
MVFFQQFPVNEDFQNRAVGSDIPFANHEAAMTNIQNQVKIM